MPTSIITRGSGVSIAGRRSRGLSPAFSRASAAYQSDGRKVGVGVPRFETVGGRRGVLVEEGTTNMVTSVASSLLDVDGGGGVATGWTKYKRTAISATWEVSQQSQRIELTGGSTLSSALVLVSIPVTGGKAYSLSVDAKKDDASPDIVASLAARWQDDVGYIGGDPTTVQTAATDFTRLSIINAVAPPNTTRIQVQLACQPQSIGATGAVRFRRAQLEAKPYATSFADGARLEERLTIQEGSMSPHGGSIAVWAKANVGTGTYQPPFDGRWSSSLPLGLLITGTVVALYFTVPQGTSFSYNTGLRVDDITAWNHYAVTYDGASVVPYLNGVSGVPKAAVIGTNRSGPLRLGVTAGGAFFNGVLSGLSIFRRCLTSSEIAAHMAGDIPNGCYHYPCDGDLWPAPGSLGAVVAPAVTTRPGRVDVVTRRGSVDIITRPGKLEVIGR